MARSKSLFSKIIAPVAALVLSLGIATGAGVGFKANAAELQEEPASGWYVVGNGAGSLSECSWQEYVPQFRLTGTAEDDANYIGVWETPKYLLYEGDQFKILYNDGSWTKPDESGWTPDVCAQFENVKQNEEAEEKDFSDGGLGNIYVNESDYYTFTLTVAEDTETGAIVLTITYTRDNAYIPPITLYDMYIVGTVASYPTCGWPDALHADGIEVPDACIKMTATTADGVTTWAATVDLVATDDFKLYNTVTASYYPSGFDDNLKVDVEGTYLVSWVEGSQEVTLTLQTPVEG